MPRLATIVIVLLALAPAVAGAAEPQDKPAARPDEDGFVPLFNGKDLAGWVPVNVAPNTFTARDGVIVCTGVPTGVMRTEKMYENFVVELEWRHLKPGGNAGFFVWSDAITAKGVPFTRSVEVQVLDGPNHPERRYTTHGDVFPIHGATMIPDNPHKTARRGASGRSYPTEDRSKPSPEWNHYRVECRDGAITLAVNGKVVTSGTNASPRKGYICLESEGGHVEWRNLRIRELPASEKLDPKHVAAADEGYRSLYNGLNLDGWNATEAAAKRWRASDWTLRYTPVKDAATDPTLTSAETFLDLDLIVDVRSAAPVDLLVRGRPLRIDPVEPGKAAWRRAVVTVREWTIVMILDDKRLPAVPVPAASLGKPTPIGLRPAAAGNEAAPGASAAADFANVYVKPVERPAPAAPGKP